MEAVYRRGSLDLKGSSGCSHNGGLVVLNVAHRLGTGQSHTVFNPLSDGLIVLSVCHLSHRRPLYLKSTLEDRQ